MNKQLIVEQLKLDEGFSAASFWDIKQWTWGYGTKAPGPYVTITREQAEVELSKAVDKAINGYSAIFYNCGTPINEVREHALVNMVYNMGTMGVYKFAKMIDDIEDDDPNDWKEVANRARQSLWYKQVTKRAERICKELEKGVKSGV
jgi:GH24 family phage-related lysozyme (muramidase)